MRLSGRTAIITGGAQGIGAAIAQRYAHEGAHVAICDVNVEHGEAHADFLRTSGYSAQFVKCNVADRLSVQRAINTTLDHFDHIDILVNNAAVVQGGDFLEITEEQFDKVIAVNLKGYFLMGQAVAKEMIKTGPENRDPCAIINMSSIHAVFGHEGQIPYTVSKGGVNQLTKAMAISLAPHGIRVNAIGPGSIATEMMRSVNSDPETMQKVMSRTPIGRIGEPSEIAAIAVFLATPEASYVTGQTIYADGGRLGLAYSVPVTEASD